MRIHIIRRRAAHKVDDLGIRPLSGQVNVCIIILLYYPMCVRIIIITIYIYYVSHHDDDDFRVNDVGDDRIAVGVDMVRDVDV